MGLVRGLASTTQSTQNVTRRCHIRTATNHPGRIEVSDFFIGQVMMTGFNFAPKFWAQCNGQLLPISQNQALFSLLGTQFGGNGTTNFALPDLRGRSPVGYASSVDPSWQPPAVQMGQTGGAENVTLLSSNLPAHTHTMAASSAAGDSRTPVNGLLATSSNSATAANLYAPSNGALVAMNTQSVATAGGNQPHPNLQPYTAINFCIALSGIFPSRD
jgi:microcystin-dependent protein